MANFDIAYGKMIIFEKGYSLDPLDAGGETVDGISRRFNPTWIGWEVLQSLKYEHDFPKNIDNSVELQNLIKAFYGINYWDSFNGDMINDSKQIIASELLESAVNQGIKTAVAYLQIALNCMNSNGTVYADLLVDGDCGSKTITTLNNLKQSDVYYVFLIMNVLQGYHYVERMRENTTQEKYCRGWLRRITINKEMS
jgi:lysozyme family protein